MEAKKITWGILLVNFILSAGVAISFYAAWSAPQHRNIVLICGTAILFVIFVFYYYLSREHAYRIKGSRIVALIFAACYLVGGFFLKGSADTSSREATIFYIVMAVIALAFLWYFYYVSIYYVRFFLSRNIKTDFQRLAGIKTFFCRHPRWISLICMLICWIPHIWLKFPAGICYDVSYQIDQGLGYATLTTHHPVFHTMLMTYFVKFGQAFGSANMGMFLFVLVEALFVGFVFSYGIGLLVKIKARNWIVLLALVFCCFSPFVAGYVGTPIKDVYFTACSVWFVILLAEMTLQSETFWTSPLRVVSLLLSAVGMVLFRNNGMYVVIPSLVVVIICTLVKHRRKWLYKVVILLCACILPVLINRGVEAGYQAESGSIAEALSLPFQQTARMVKYHPDRITEEEKEAIDAVLPYDQLAELYDPLKSDPVKFAYKESASRSDLINYFRVWAKEFVKEPLCYVDAVVEQNIALLYPGYNNYMYYIDVHDSGYEYVGEEPFSTPDAIKDRQPAYRNVLTRAHEIPILSLFNNMAVYVIGALILGLLILAERKFRHLFYYIPVFLALLIIVLAPCIVGHVRYAYPVMYAFPFILGFLSSDLKVDQPQIKQEAEVL